MIDDISKEPMGSASIWISGVHKGDGVGKNIEMSSKRGPSFNW